MNNYFLRIENDKFGFVVEGIHTIIESDIAITQEDYDLFFELQGQGKQFKIKEVATGENLFDIIEEYVPPVDTTPQAPTQEERILALEELMLEIL